MGKRKELNSRLVSVLASWVLAAGMLPAQVSDLQERALIIGDQAWIVVPAHALFTTPGFVVDTQWLSDSSGSLVQRLEFADDMGRTMASVLKGDTEKLAAYGTLDFWNRKTNRLTRHLKLDSRAQRIMAAEMSCDGKVVVAHIQNLDTKALEGFINISSLGSTAGKNYPLGTGVAVSRTLPYIAILSSSGDLPNGNQGQLEILNTQTGQRKITALNGGKDLIPDGFWLDSKRLLVISWYGTNGAKGGHFLYNPATEQTQEITRDQLLVYMKEGLANPEPPLPYSIDNVPIQLADGRRSTILEWTALAKPDPATGAKVKPVRFAPGGYSPSLSPDGQRLIFQWEASTMMAEIVPLAAADLVAKPKVVDKEQAILQAKQIGLGLMMYSADNDDVLPNGQDFAGGLLPYLKNEELLSGFVYTYQGPFQMDLIKEPDKQELGFVRGPGGSAILYADGHVVWKPDPST